MWKDIKGYEGLYQVSDDGQVRRLMKNGNIRYLKNRDGVYLTVSLCKDCIKKSYNIHRLVAETYLDKPTDKTEVNHKDGNKHNNHVSNLEWVTARENIDHAVYELKHYPWGKPPRPVKCLNAETGEVVNEFNSVSDAARAIGKISARTAITLVCQGYQPTAYGYKWVYAD